MMVVFPLSYYHKDKHIFYHSLFLSNYLSILFETRISVPLIPGSRYRADGGRNPAGIRVFTRKLACFLLNLSVTFERNKGNGQIAVAAFL